jgi:molybdate-binding protein
MGAEGIGQRTRSLTSGSRDGLERLARGQAMLAGLHIRDPNGETYNVDTIRREIPYPDIVAIRWAEREQGCWSRRTIRLGSASTTCSQAAADHPAAGRRGQPHLVRLAHQELGEG